ncbi:MAG TPA: YrdB family protein [Anaerolineales bacterium]|nr:YrdB family protein [Anaerolineales bacterium]
MANNPLNLALRFLLELYALYAMGYWSWHRFDGLTRILLMIIVPLFAATLWGVFRIPGESPKGRAPVPVPGAVRLLIEACFFGFAVWGLFDAGAIQAGTIFGIALVIHYALSYDRIFDLLFR